MGAIRQLEQSVAGGFLWTINIIKGGFIYEKETPKEASTDVQKENTILPRGLLEINLGVPTMIVCCNTEVMVLQDLNYYSSRKIKPSQDL